MVTEKSETKELFEALDKTTMELLQLISSCSQKQINTIPVEDSWTAAQVAEHIRKSNDSIAKALEMEGKKVERSTIGREPEFQLHRNKNHELPEVSSAWNWQLVLTWQLHDLIQ